MALNLLGYAAMRIFRLGDIHLNELASLAYSARRGIKLSRGGLRISI